GDHDGIDVRVEQLRRVLGREVEAELLLHRAQPGAAAADADEIDVLTGRVDREVVAGRPPSGADRAEADTAPRHGGAHRVHRHVRTPSRSPSTTRPCCASRSRLPVMGKIRYSAAAGGQGPSAGAARWMSSSEVSSSPPPRTSSMARSTVAM